MQRCSAGVLVEWDGGIWRAYFMVGAVSDVLFHGIMSILNLIF